VLGRVDRSRDRGWGSFGWGKDCVGLRPVASVCVCFDGTMGRSGDVCRWGRHDFGARRPVCGEARPEVASVETEQCLQVGRFKGS
jgi:hypothetical protein